MVPQGHIRRVEIRPSDRRHWRRLRSLIFASNGPEQISQTLGAIIRAHRAKPTPMADHPGHGRSVRHVGGRLSITLAGGMRIGRLAAGTGPVPS